ncbi:hypothetical protein UlMin_002865 [Ulmus minor]
MEKQRTIFIAYDGKWDKNRYIEHRVKTITIEEEITHIKLKEVICGRIGLEKSVPIMMTFDMKMETSRGMAIEDDKDVAEYMNLMKNNPIFATSTIIVEREENQVLVTCPVIVETDANEASVAASSQGSSRITESNGEKEDANRLCINKNKEIPIFSGQKRKNDKRPLLLNAAEIFCFDLSSPQQIIRAVDGVDDVEVGMVFESKKLIKLCMSMIAMEGSFQFKTQRSDGMNFWLKCDQEDCTWLMKARSLGETKMFKITKYDKVHKCSVDIVKSDHKQATSSVISEFIKPKLLDPKVQYGINNIIQDVKQKFGVNMSYEKAWRSRVEALDDIRGSSEDSFRLLPRTITRIEKDEHDRPLIVVDGTFLKGKYKGTLFVACAKDGNNGIFPLAFGVGDWENNLSWEWFMSRLKETFGNRNEVLCIVSDRHQSIERAIKLVAYRKEDFDYFMAKLGELSPKIREYVLEEDPRRWARCFYPCRRYNAQTSNIAESMNSALKKARELHIVSILELLREKLQTWFVERTKAANEVETLTLSRFNITENQREFIVDLENRTCTCRRFEHEELPCAHAIAAIDKRKLPKHPFCGTWYLNSEYKETYKCVIHPVGNEDDWDIPEEIREIILKHPNYKVRKGRRQKERYRPSSENYVAKRKCGRCKQLGHTRKVCIKTPIANAGSKRKSFEDA